MRILIAEDDAVSLVHAAKPSLYRAKNNGRNRVEIAADEEMDRVCGVADL